MRSFSGAASYVVYGRGLDFGKRTYGQLMMSDKLFKFSLFVLSIGHLFILSGLQPKKECVRYI